MYRFYERRPEIYKAVQWTGENKQDIIDLIGDRAVFNEVHNVDTLASSVQVTIYTVLNVSVKRKNKDGSEKEIFHRVVKIGDYISVNAYNKIRVYTKSAFERIYKVVELTMDMEDPEGLKLTADNEKVDKR